MTNIPGAKAKHAVITDECRDNRGDLGAFEEVIRRLKLEYDLITRMRHPEKGLNFHLVLAVENTKRERKPLPEREEGRFNTLADRQRLKDELSKGEKEKKYCLDCEELVAALAGYRLTRGTECPFCDADLRDDEKSSGDEGQGAHNTDCPVVRARTIGL